MRFNQTNVSAGTANGHPAVARKGLLDDLAPNTLKLLALSLKKQWKCYRQQLSKCRRKLSERAVHDLRVEARRLLAILDLLGPFLAPGRGAKAQTALKRHLDTFDELRDTQVLLLAVAKLRAKFSAARRFHRFLKKREARLVRATRKNVKRLRYKPLGKLIDACASDVKHWRQGRDARQANRLLLRAIARAFTLTKKLKDRIDPGDSQSIHRTRVAFKSFRYVIEALAGHLSWVNEPLLASLRRYQTLMGDIQDAEVLLRAFDKFLNKKRTRTQSALRFEGELLRRRQRLIKVYLRASGRLLDFWPQTHASSPVQSSPTLRAHQPDQVSRLRRPGAGLATPQRKPL